jgi:hypothetical protein
MANFSIHLMGQHQALEVDLPHTDLHAVMEEASRAKFLAGHLAEPDEHGVCRRVMIATSRIQCVIEAD